MEIFGCPREVRDRVRKRQRLAQGAHPRLGIANRSGVAADAAQRADLGLSRVDQARGCQRLLGKAVRLVEVALQPECLGQDALHLGACDGRRLRRQ